jgi:hypothetical protein
MASREAEKAVRKSNSAPNKRERLSAQYGQLDDLTAGNWASLPTSIQDAIERIAAEVATLKGGTID